MHALLSSTEFFQNHIFPKPSFRTSIRVSDSVDPDQAQGFVRPDLGPNCSKKRVKYSFLQILIWSAVGGGGIFHDSLFAADFFKLNFF